MTQRTEHKGTRTSRIALSEQSRLFCSKFVSASSVSDAYECVREYSLINASERERIVSLAHCAYRATMPLALVAGREVCETALHAVKHKHIPRQQRLRLIVVLRRFKRKITGQDVRAYLRMALAVLGNCDECKALSKDFIYADAHRRLAIIRCLVRIGTRYAHRSLLTLSGFECGLSLEVLVATALIYSEKQIGITKSLSLLSTENLPLIERARIAFALAWAGNITGVATIEQLLGNCHDQWLLKALLVAIDDLGASSTQSKAYFEQLRVEIKLRLAGERARETQ